MYSDDASPVMVRNSATVYKSSTNSPDDNESRKEKSQRLLTLMGEGDKEGSSRVADEWTSDDNGTSEFRTSGGPRVPRGIDISAGTIDISASVGPVFN